jgi:type I restriction enzyme S subunit
VIDGKIRFQWLAREIDKRNSAEVDYPLMSVSQTKGVIPRSELMGNEGRAESLDNYKICMPGQIVINRMSASSGALGLAKQAGLVSPDYAVIEATKLADPHFLEYLMKSSWFVGEMVARLRGIGAGGESASVRTPRINIADLGEIEVSLPPIQEQRHIADYLDDQVTRVEQVLEAKSLVLRLLEDGTQAAFNTLFGDPFFVQGSAFRKSRRLGPCLISNDGGVWGDDATGVNDTYVLRSTEMTKRGYWRDLENAELRSLSDSDKRNAMLMLDDIIVTKASGSAEHIGKAALVSEEVVEMDACYGNFMQRLRVDNGILSPKYLHYFLKSGNGRAQLNYLGTTSTGLMNISAEVLNNLRIPIASLVEQIQIIDLLVQIEHDFSQKMDLIDRSILSLRELKTSLITAAVTGQFDVTTGRSVA